MGIPTGNTLNLYIPWQCRHLDNNNSRKLWTWAKFSNIYVFYLCLYSFQLTQNYTLLVKFLIGNYFNVLINWTTVFISFLDNLLLAYRNIADFFILTDSSSFTKCSHLSSFFSIWTPSYILLLCDYACKEIKDCVE